MILHKINNYISELSYSDFDIENFYMTLIDAPTGCGKTEMMFSLSKRNKSIIVFPYSAQVVQQEQIRPNFQFLYETQNFDPHGPTNICCTYDKLVKLINHLDVENYVLHVDECHNLYVSADFRSNVMFIIANSIKEYLFKKVIFYSSTYDTSHLNEHIPITNHHKISFNKDLKENVTCVHLSNGTLFTLNEAMLHYFLQNDLRNEKILIFRNNLTENKALAELLEMHGYKTLNINSEKRNEDDIVKFLKTKRIENETSVLITTSMLQEGISINNFDITQIHYLDKHKSATSIRQFSSRARKSKHEILVWFKNNQKHRFKNDIEQEKHEFQKNHREVLFSFNNLLKYVSEKNIKRYAYQMIESNNIHGSGWMKGGLRIHDKKVVLDFTRIANYFYNLEIENESSNSLLLGEKMKKYGFTVHYLDLKLTPDSKITKRCKTTSKRVKEDKKQIVKDFIDSFTQHGFDPIERKKELVQLEKKTEIENKELKMLTRWINLTNHDISKEEIMKVLLNNSYHLGDKKDNNLFYNIMKSKIKLNMKYDSAARSEILINAENELNLNPFYKNTINIKKIRSGEVSGRISKNIFMSMFDCKYHLIRGNPFVTVLNFDPIFCKKENL